MSLRTPVAGTQGPNSNPENHLRNTSLEACSVSLSVLLKEVNKVRIVSFTWEHYRSVVVPISGAGLPAETSLRAGYQQSKKHRRRVATLSIVQSRVQCSWVVLPLSLYVYLPESRLLQVLVEIVILLGRLCGVVGQVVGSISETPYFKPQIWSSCSSSSIRCRRW